MVTTAGKAFNECRPFALGEVTVSFEGATAIVEGPPSGDAPVDLPPDPDVVRAFVREDALGRYRPLCGARTMRPGWRVRCASAAQLEAVLDTIYPLALRHQAMHARGELNVVGLDSVLSRQSGRYRVGNKLSEGGRSLARAILCGACVRSPLWAGDGVGPGDIPCPEPCSVLVALCREAALWEDEPPEPAPVDPGIAFAAFDEPGNQVREAFLAAMRARQR